MPVGPKHVRDGQTFPVDERHQLDLGHHAEHRAVHHAHLPEPDDRDALADAVVGSATVPSPAACYAVAGALFVASGLVADVPLGPYRLRALGRAGVATVLAVRGVAGLAGRTDLLSPRSTSPKFRRIDRMYLAPLCLALAAGAATAGRR